MNRGCVGVCVSAADTKSAPRLPPPPPPPPPPPGEQELERVTPRIEAELETLWDEEEKERKGLSSLRQRLISQWRAALGEGGSLEDDHDDDDHA
eukprot:3759267-Rhodomonas_salina.2